MKITLLLIVSMLLASAQNVEITDRIGVEGPLVFNETEFLLKWTDKPKDSYYIQEYLPESETLDSLRQMLTCHIFLTELSTREAIQRKVQELEVRKKTDKICNYQTISSPDQLISSPDEKEYIVDFLLSEIENDSIKVIEFNIYKYQKVQINESDKALLVFTYTKRAYGEEITSFFENLATFRKKHLNEMIGFKTPDILIKDIADSKKD